MIGGRYKHSNVLSRVVLIARGLDLNTGVPGRYGVLKVCEPLKSARPFDSSAVIPAGKHLFPFRTEKLSLPGPMVLGGQPPGRVGRRRFTSRKRAARAAFFHAATLL